MRALIIGVALSWVCCFTIPRAASAAGNGGHSGGGHSAGGHAAGGHAAGGHAAGGHAAGGHAAGGHASGTGGGGHAGGGQTAASGHASSRTGTHASAGSSHAAPSAPPVTTHSMAPPARERGAHAVTGMAVPRVGTRDLFVANPSTYAPHYSVSLSSSSLLFRHNTLRPLFVGAGYGVYPYSFGSSTCVSGRLADCLPPVGESSSIAYTPSGIVRLNVEPGSAEVWVDGFYVGTVDDFVASLAGLNLEAGAHHVEFRSPGYETLAVDMKIEANRVITYRGALKSNQQ